LKKNKRKKERKEKLMLMECRSLDSPPHFALFASSSFFFFYLLQWRFLERVWSYPMNQHLLMNQIHSPFKSKSKQQPSHKRVENEGSQKNRRKPGRGTATTAVAATTVWPWLPPRSVVVTTVGPWCPLAGQLLFVLRTVRFAFRLEPWVAFLGLFGLGFLVLFPSSLA